MDPTTITWIWLIAGLAVAISEIFLPGGIFVFMGAAAMLVAGLRALGVDSLALSFALWFAMSIGLILTAGRFVRRHMNGERDVTVIDEATAAFGEVVDVASAIEPGQIGRVRYQGTTWKARCMSDRSIPAGAKVRLIDKDNLCWTVEPVLDPIPCVAEQAKDGAVQNERVGEKA